MRLKIVKGAGVMKAMVRSSLKIQDVDLRADWLKFLDVSPSTARNYYKAMKKFDGWCSERGIKSPSEETLIEYKGWLQETVSSSTAQLYFTAVKLFFRWLAKRGLYNDIGLGLKGVKVSTEHKRDALTVEQCRRVLGAMKKSTLKGLRDRAMMILLLTTGMRSIELVRADVGDMVLWQGEWFLLVQGKGRSEKAERVRIAASTLSVLNEYLDARGDREGALFKSVGGRNKGGRLTTGTVSKIIKRAFKAVGLDSPRLTCHSCRHTFATTALLNGLDIASVAMVLRHRSINTTQIYRHDLDRLTNRAELSVADSILGGVG